MRAKASYIVVDMQSLDTPGFYQNSPFLCFPCDNAQRPCRTLSMPFSEVSTRLTLLKPQGITLWWRGFGLGWGVKIDEGRNPSLYGMRSHPVALRTVLTKLLAVAVKRKGMAFPPAISMCLRDPFLRRFIKTITIRT